MSDTENTSAPKNEHFPGQKKKHLYQIKLRKNDYTAKFLRFSSENKTKLC